MIQIFGISTLVTLFTISFGHAQENGPFDKIIKKDDTVIEGKILRIRDHTVEVDPKGSVHFMIIPRSDIDILLYSNNTMIRMSRREATEPRVDTGRYGNIDMAPGEDVSGLPENHKRISFHVPKGLIAANESLHSTMKDVVVVQHRKEMQMSLRRRILLVTNKQGGKEKVATLIADIDFQTVAPALLSGARFKLKDVHAKFLIATDVDERGNPKKELAKWERSNKEEFELPGSKNTLSSESLNLAKKGKVISFDSFSYKGQTWSPEVWFSEFNTSGVNPHYYTFTVSVSSVIKD